MTIDKLVQMLESKKPGPLPAKVTLTSQFQGVKDTAKSTEIPNHQSALITDKVSVSTENETIGDVTVMEGEDSKTIYMAECEACITALMNNAKHAGHFTTEVNDLDVIVTVTDIAPASQEYFSQDKEGLLQISGDTGVFTVNCDPANPLKQTLKDGYYAQKHIGYFITLQVNAALKTQTKVVKDGVETIHNKTLKTVSGSTKKAPKKVVETKADEIQL